MSSWRNDDEFRSQPAAASPRPLPLASEERRPASLSERLRTCETEAAKAAVVHEEELELERLVANRPIAPRKFY